jgi:hypothetical protein
MDNELLLRWVYFCFAHILNLFQNPMLLIADL